MPWYQFPGFDEAARLLQRSGLFYRARLCPLSGISGSGDSSSLTLLRLMYPHWGTQYGTNSGLAGKYPQVKTVFIHNRWIELVNNHRDTRLKQLVADGMRHTCARLRKAGKQIVLLGPVPEWTFGPRKLMRRNALLNANRTDHARWAETSTRGSVRYSPCWSTWNPQACAASFPSTAPSIKMGGGWRKTAAN